MPPPRGVYDKGYLPSLLSKEDCGSQSVKGFVIMLKNIRNIYHSSRLALIISFLIFAVILACTVMYSGVSANAIKKEAYTKYSVLLHKIMIYCRLDSKRRRLPLRQLFV